MGSLTPIAVIPFPRCSPSNHALHSALRAEREFMEIAKDKVVTIDYTLTGEQGQVLDTSDGSEPLSYLHGAGNIIPGLEHALEVKAVRDATPEEVAHGHVHGAGTHEH